MLVALLIMMYAFVLLFALSAVQTARVAHSRKQPQLYWMAANFATATIGNLFTMIIQVPMLSLLFLMASSVCIVIFIHQTFYRDRKSPYLLIIGLLVVLGAYQVYYTLQNPGGNIGITQLGFAVVWGWQAILSFITRRRIAADRTVEDWVKARYVIWFAYSFVMLLIDVRMLLPIPPADIEYLINSPLTLLAVIAQYITWAMPEPIRRYLNRDYQPVMGQSPSEIMNMSEEELLRQVQA